MGDKSVAFGFETVTRSELTALMVCRKVPELRIIRLFNKNTLLKIILRAYSCATRI